MSKKDKREAISYLHRNKISDFTDETRLMRLNRLIANKRVTIGILIVVDIIIFFALQYGTNVVMGSIATIREAMLGNFESSGILSIEHLFNFKHGITWYVVVLIFIACIDVKLAYNIQTNFGDINKNQKGSRRFTYLKEIQEQYDAIPLKMKHPYSTYYGKGGVPVCHYGTTKKVDSNGKIYLEGIENAVIYIDRSPVNNEIIGITRSGKGEFFVFPIIDIYSRAENKIYFISHKKLNASDKPNEMLSHKDRYKKKNEEMINNPVELDIDTGWYMYSADVYYDEKLGMKECHGELEAISKKTLSLSKDEFDSIIKEYEKEYNVTYNPEKEMFEKTEEPEEESVVAEETQSDCNEAYNIEEDERVFRVGNGKCFVVTEDKIQPYEEHIKDFVVSITQGSVKALYTITNEELEETFDEKAESRKNVADGLFMLLAQDPEVQAILESENKLEEWYSILSIKEMDEKEWIEEQKTDAPKKEKVANEDKEPSEYTSPFRKDFSKSEEELQKTLEESQENFYARTFTENKEKEEKRVDKTEDYLDVLKRIRKKQGINEFKFHRNMQASMLIADPKCELFLASKKTLEMRGYDVYLLNLENPFMSSGYNPLQLITDTYKSGYPAEASQIARSLAYSIFSGDSDHGENAFFYDNASFCVASLIMAKVIDCIQADEDENNVLYIEHIEKTKKFNALPEEEKERIWNIADKCEQLKIKLKLEKDKLLKISLEKEIESLESELTPYNYSGADFVPSTKHEKTINLKTILLEFNALAEEKLAPKVQGGEPTSALDEFFAQRDRLDVARCLYAGIKIGGEGKSRASIMSTVFSKLTGFQDEMISKMTARSSFNLRDIGFGEKPIAIFFSQPDYDSSNAFLNSIFLSQVYYTLAKTCTRTKGGKCLREVIFLLDEFGNIPPIVNMSSMITVCLGRNIRFNLIIQSYSQVADKYGDNDSKTINGNCGNQIYILTEDDETAENYSKGLGNRTIVNISRMGSKMELFSSKQITESTEEKPLLDPNELKELIEGECVIQRVMKRTDIQGRDVKPRPIFNTGETRFPYRYQYMSDYFPNGNGFEDVNADSCADLNMKEYISDVEHLLQTVLKHADPEYQQMFEQLKNTYMEARTKQIKCFTEKAKIIKHLRKLLSEMAKYSDAQIENITLADVEKYFIPFEANLPSFRRELYFFDFHVEDDETIGKYGEKLIKFIKQTLGSDFDDVADEYNWMDENVFLSTTISDLKEIMENCGIDTKTISIIDSIVNKAKNENNGMKGANA